MRTIGLEVKTAARIRRNLKHMLRSSALRMRSLKSSLPSSKRHLKMRLSQNDTAGRRERYVLHNMGAVQLPL